MKHLTDEQLSAYLDGVYRGREAEEFGRHLAACPPCREALAELAAQDQALEPALRHDPGEAYFETFAARVEDRIRAEGLAGAATRGEGFDLGRFFRSPRALAWTGAIAVVVAGGGLALMTTREVVPPTLRDREITSRIESAAPAEPQEGAPGGAPAPAALAPGAANQAAAPREEASPEQAVGGPVADRLDERERGARLEAKDQVAAPAPEAQRPAGPARAMEMRRTESGEEVPVRRPGEPALAKAPPAPAPGGRVRKKTLAEPLETKPAPAASALDGAAPAPGPAPPTASTWGQLRLATPAGEVRLCGEVRDAQGRPLTGAQVVVSDLGRSAVTDPEGRFCVSVPRGDHALSVMAVGYVATRRDVRAEGGEAPVVVTLAAVPVLEGDGVMAYKSPQVAGRPSTTRIATAEPRDAYAGLPDSLRGDVREAQRLTAAATSRRSAPQYDAAAGAWERALRSLAGGPLELETRRNLATARYRAWELSPSDRRARAAVEALAAYVSRAPAGPERAQAALWLDQVRP